MDAVSNIISWIQANWVNVLAVVGALDIALGFIVKMTPNQIDDNIYEIVHNFFAKLIKK